MWEFLLRPDSYDSLVLSMTSIFGPQFLQILVSLAVSLCVVACTGVDKYPLQNPSTGEQVICTTPRYWMLPAYDDLVIVDACVRACRRRGFYFQYEGIIISDSKEDILQDTLKEFIPKECYPEDRGWSDEKSYSNPNFPLTPISR